MRENKTADLESTTKVLQQHSQYHTLDRNEHGLENKIADPGNISTQRRDQGLADTKVKR